MSDLCETCPSLDQCGAWVPGASVAGEQAGASQDQDQLMDQPQADPERLQGTKHKYQLIYLTLAYLPPETEQELQNSVLETRLLLQGWEVPLDS